MSSIDGSESCPSNNLRHVQVSRKYFEQLDGVRALAVLGPLIVHFWPDNVPDSPYTKAIAHLGSLGVDLFFVISGFLITGILLHSKQRISEGTDTLKGTLITFFLRRSLRIFPIYYLVLLALLVLGMPEIRAHWSWYFGYASNYLFMIKNSWGGALSHTWSLAVEEQFYLLWPFLVLCVRRNYLPALFTTMFLMAPVLRITLIAIGTSPMSVAKSAFTCFDPLCGGALLALWFANGASLPGWNRLRSIGLLGTAAALMLAAYYVVFLRGGPMNPQVPLLRTAATLAFMLFVGAAAIGRTGRVGRILTTSSVQYIGRISYGLYLYHLPVAWVINNTLEFNLPRNLGSLFIYTGITLAVASVSYYFIERPVNRFKDQFRSAPQL